MNPPPYDPLNPGNLGASIEGALLSSACGPLPPPNPFRGAGIYAIYYRGRYPLYAPISSPSCDVPIYVGKAVPPGSRRGAEGEEPDPDQVLWRRLVQHGQSIEQAQNLDIADFACRYLVVEHGLFIPLGESLAIRRFTPLWNSGPIAGFGIHNPGSGRSNQERSAWDTLHPGRPWAVALAPPSRGPNQLAEAVRLYLAGRLPPIVADEDP